MPERTSTPEHSTDTIGSHGADLSALPEVRAQDEDFEVPSSALDPHMTPCPAWCVSLNEGHHMVTVEEDRLHSGPAARIGLRHRPAAWYEPTKTFVLGHAEIYLAHPTGAADPTVRVQLNDTVGRVDLDLDEAESIARTLLAMVEASR